MSMFLSEDWPPYKWLWSRIGGRPWTHIMRDNTKVSLPIFVGLTFLTLGWWSTRKAKLPVWAILGFGFTCALAAHVWW